MIVKFIAAFVSQYSDILYDTVKCELADFYRQIEFFPKLQLPVNTKYLQSCKTGSHNIQLKH